MRTLRSAGRSFYAFGTSEVYRNAVLIKLKNPPHLFQPFNYTEEKRHPRYFEYARAVVGDGMDRRILSFGCSTGKEVFSLRDYFPHAFIKGIDINPRNIAKCKHRLRTTGDENISFAVGWATFGEPTASYDAIFCLAVLTHGDLVTSRAERCDHLISFADFELVVGDLARCLKIGGLLFIAASSFRFEDTRIYDCLRLFCRRIGRTRSANFRRPIGYCAASPTRTSGFARFAESQLCNTV